MMLTQEEKDLLLSLIGTVNISGTRAKVKATMEKLDALERKIQAMEVEKAAEAPKAAKAKK